jgi:DNA repair protein RadD
MSSAFSLRPYQIEILNVLHRDLQTEQNVLLQAITGAGKTVVLCRLINRYYKETSRRFLILVHKQELVEQFHKTFETMTDIPSHDIGILCAGLGRKERSGRVSIATVQTFAGLANDYPGCNLLIIDEAHRISIGNGSQYDTTINLLRAKNPNMRIVGCTSTPSRLGHGYIYGDMAIGPNLFPRLNHQVKYTTLRDQGFLMNLEGQVAIHQKLTSDLAGVRTSGDYVVDQLGEIMSREIHLHTAVEAIEKWCGDFKHVCVFCCTIDHARKIQGLMGHGCAVVHSQLGSMERWSEMDAWKSGKKRIIASVNILIEGFDFPPLDCLVMARPTLSSSLYLQAIGRILRISPGKTRAFLLDLTDNTARFGTDIDNVRVTIPKAVEEKEKKKRELEKICPECESVVHVARYECPECGFEWPPVEKVIADSLPDMHGVVFGKKMQTRHEVAEVAYQYHSKAGKLPSMRVEYYSDTNFIDKIASEWVCIEHTGFARQKAKDWWDDCTDSLPFPNSVQAALDVSHTFFRPTAIITEPDGKYTRIVKREFDYDIPF